MTRARRAAAWLAEKSKRAGPVSRSIAEVVGPLLARGLVRPAVVPPHVRLVCVGGATFGGSGKSRIAMACARALEGSILVGHGYCARDRTARFVDPRESVAAAGDEALVAARAGLRVVIAESRQRAIDFASRHTDTLVLDGPLAITSPPPRRLSILALDADAPWGDGRQAPAGDLRAPRDVLLALADEVIHVPRSIDLAALPPRPFGLFTALARPERLIRALEPDVVVSAPDHGPADARAISRDVAWVATPKCALHLEELGVAAHVLRDDFKLTPTWAALTVPRPHE
ncbi:MAG: tetraacyldisaccharide 4'-kinase [Labilithrix sp.]|nr:tetraacyldisaccharide 4'-kinase [Labilithrix sp.]MCW5818146.1 tetraacyldisaccharide 4'-kinase [Labilithrix sp.]